MTWKGRGKRIFTPSAAFLSVKYIIYQPQNKNRLKRNKMKITKKNSNDIIFEDNSNTMKDCVINAINSGADLRDADLRGAYLCGAYLRGADLRGAKNIPFIPFSCPSDGEFIGWKKVSNKLIKLFIPSDARRSSATSNKCRCDKAKVLEITDLDGNNPIASITNYNYAETLYVVGEMVYPDSFDENRWNECSHGINFFINKQEAINY